MGTFQHHDAITGTEKQSVADDYVRQLTDAINEAEKPIGDIIRWENEKLAYCTIPSSLVSRFSVVEGRERTLVL